jgi:hypothetical protein
MSFWKILEIVLEIFNKFPDPEESPILFQNPDANDLAQHTTSCVWTFENPNTLGIYEKVQGIFREFSGI